MKRVCVVFLIALAVGVAGLRLFAQTAAAPQNSPAPQRAVLFRIAGRVFSASSGRALERADVVLSTPPQGNDPQGNEIAEITTGEDGGFRFDQLQPGKYTLRASRRGYVASNYDAHEGFSTSIVVGPNVVSGLDVTDLRFRLLQEAIVGGTVMDEAGDPVRRTQVALYRQNTRNGLGNVARTHSTMTDDTGAYEFAQLEPGTYFVSVNATPWYTTRPRNADESAETARSPLDVAYPLTFYADATDSDAATPIPVRAGDRITANFSMHPVPAIHLSIQQPATPGQNLLIPRLTQSVFGSEQFLPIGQMITTRGGSQTVEISGLAPGHYQIQYTGPLGAGASETASGTIDLTTDQILDPSSVPTGVDISGKVGMAGSGRLPRGLSVSLRTPGNPDASIPSNPSTRVAEDGSFTFRNVSAGTWELAANARGTTLAVTQMEASGGTAEGRVLTVSTQPVSIAALLAEGETAVTGFAGRDGRPVPGVMVLLVPRDLKANRELFRRDQSDSDGSFMLRRVVPGSYTLVAVEEGWTLDWARPEVIGKYLAQGQAVEVPSGKSDLDIRKPIEVQPR